MNFDKMVKSILEKSNYTYKTEEIYQYLIDNNKKFVKFLDKLNIDDANEMAKVIEVLILLRDYDIRSEDYQDRDLKEFLNSHQIDNLAEVELIEYPDESWKISSKGEDFLFDTKKYLTDAINTNKKFSSIKQDYYYMKL